MPPVRFEPTNSTGERPQIHALDRTATIEEYIEEKCAIEEYTEEKCAIE
jgi:hypothetical protein